MEHSKFFSELKRYFERFPGIGPRQASRFVWTIMDFSKDEQKQLGEALQHLSDHLRRCENCFRAFAISDGESICNFCDGAKRDQTSIMIVEKDNDLLNIEKAGLYKGTYHVLGGVYDPLDEQTIVRNRIRALFNRVSKKNAPHDALEIVFALSPTKLGEFTTEYIKKILEPLIENGRTITITRLGRGLSTGVDMEYVDELTLKQALENRK